MAKQTTATVERLTDTKAYVKVGNDLAVFEATSRAAYQAELECFCYASGATRIREVRT
jgi:hypothetical protein